ncbi:DUF6525 family protein [Salipiger sp. 1_MG-2023]|uniref:DUF6525 family protein n=1 Tax=Salipiger sp. 1_MG-2023 TaxID=3062665 RepID=UPI0026E24AEA|nr:DUF6525 family protein [Salipiger sp. 1_MG-2023]MDO6588252.1 DUF6525 family protein [Salipiger sp. 1_MG-2023]
MIHRRASGSAATNRGATSLRTRRRHEDPMQAFDALPAPVRSWLSQAALPWSPASCRKILRKARARGESLEDVLARLDRAQQKTLARDRYAQSRLIAADPSGTHQDSNR